MAAPQVFVSYRRDDSAGFARALHDALARRFGADAVFIDVDDIGGGEPFAEVIARSLRGAGVLLALIGRRWAGERAGAPARLFEDGDFVRREIEIALARGLAVVPLLVDGAAMPAAADLPPSIAALAALNALPLANADFAADVDRIVAAVQAHVAPAVPPPSAEGNWCAEVDYDWPGAHHVERFAFSVEGDELFGTASFLGVARGVLDGRVDGDVLRFVTRTQEQGGGGIADLVHRYRARLSGDELVFVMQTEGGPSAHVPVRFVARRA